MILKAFCKEHAIIGLILCPRCGLVLCSHAIDMFSSASKSSNASVVRNILEHFACLQYVTIKVIQIWLTSASFDGVKVLVCIAPGNLTLWRGVQVAPIQKALGSTNFFEIGRLFGLWFVSYNLLWPYDSEIWFCFFKPDQFDPLDQGPAGKCLAVYFNSAI